MDIEDTRAIARLSIGFLAVLGGSWDLVTTYNWAYSPTCNWANLHKAIEGDYK